MQRTRREFLDEFLDYVGEPGDAAARNLAERALNRAIERVWKAAPWQDYASQAPLQLTLTANHARYALPDYFGRLGEGYVRNLSKGGYRLTGPLAQLEVDRLFPEAGTAFETPDDPTHFTIGGSCGVHTQPAVAGEALEVVSDSNTDTAVRVTIGGSDAEHRWRRIQVTLTGTAPVGLGTWSYVDEFGKAPAAGTDPVTELTSSVGTVALRTVTDQTVLQTLFPEEASKEHAVFTVYRKPRAADVLTIPFLRRPKRLLFDGDPLPGEWTDAVWEDLLIQWRVNSGELTLETHVPRPHLQKLVEDNNAKRPRPRKQPFLGGVR